MTDLGTPHLRFEVDGPLAWCTIDRPEARNALTAAMYFGLRRAVDRVNRDPGLHALIITGTGDVFAPGGELGGRHGDDEIDIADLIGTDLLPFDTIRKSPKPVLSAVNGICQAGGLTIAMLSDVAVASDRATFRAAELLRGIPDAYYAAIMPAHIGIARTRELMMTGRVIDAAEAQDIGLIARVVPHDQLREAVIDCAHEILRTGPTARFHFKRLVNAQYGQVDEMTFIRSLGSSEVREGMSAFMERRPPSWVPEGVHAEGRL